MPRPKRGFRCSQCSWQTPAYVGRCPQCEAWNSLEAYAEAPAAGPGRPRTGLSVAARTVPLSEAPAEDGARLLTRIPELDRVLGGGIVPGSLVLVGGDPGIGKSTLMLQAAATLAASGLTVAYVCGEESPRQVRLRATRLGITGEGITLVPETSLDAALEAALAIGAQVTIIDSIQSVYIEGLDSRAGGPAQLAEAGARLVSWSKSNEIATFVTGHVTKGGEIAGPRLLEHLVDAVLYFESAESGAFRVLRATKNRFGATDEVGVFEMTGQGLSSVESPSAAFLEARLPGASGCAVTAIIEGSRPLAVEVQALAVPSQLANPRRIASGLELSRLHLLLAVLARRGGIAAGASDVVTSVSGGLRLRDPGADLAVVAALASAVRDIPLPPDAAFLGEVALTGAIRPAQQAQRRLAELARLGITRCYAPPSTPGILGITILPTRTLQSLVETLFSQP
jgi:DNA repair protein RadA/Sms